MVGQREVLDYIKQHPRVTVQNIYEHFKIRQSSASRMVHQLLKYDFISASIGKKRKQELEACKNDRIDK